MNYKYFILSFTVIAILTYIYLTSTTKSPMLNPLLSDNSSTTPITSPLSVFGFLPYWNLSRNYQSPKAITDSAYFAINLEADGTLTNDVGLQRLNLYIQNYLSTTPHANHHIVVTAFNTTHLESLLSNPNYSQRAINNILSTLKSGSFDGINLDIEPNTPPKPTTSAMLTEFIKQLRSELSLINNNSLLTLDLPPNPNRHNVWDLNQLSLYIDYFIVMSYDYHRPQSMRAGPVAPLFGSNRAHWSQDVSSNIETIMKQVDNNKLILGVPLYGYEWQTTTTQFASPTYPQSGQLATIRRINQIKKTHTIHEAWDSLSNTPWFWYQQGEGTWQVYYENTRSINLKIELAQNLNLAGIAFWALGYEDDYATFWESIQL